MPKCPSESVRVLVGDKTPMNGQLVADALGKDTRIKICGSHSTSNDILRTVQTFNPHVVLLSSHLADGEKKGFEVTRNLRATHPGAACVILLDVADRACIVESFRCGAKGVFSRTESIKLLTKCVHCVKAGQVWANNDELHMLLGVLREGSTFGHRAVSAESLSKREYEVVQAVAEGLTNREIAQDLGLTEHTVKGYLYRIFEKLGVSTRVELALHAFSSVQVQPAKPKTRTAAASGQARSSGGLYERRNGDYAVAVGQLEGRY